MKKIIFDGAYGIRSFGDDAPLIVLADMLRQRIGDFDGVVVNRHADDYGYSEYGLRSIRGIEYESKDQSLGKWFRGFNPGDEKDDLCRLYQELETADLLVLGAGNFLVDYTIDLLKGPVPRFLLMSLMAQMAGTPIFWFGMSVGPLKTKMGQHMSRLAANLASAISVRDQKSITELKDLGVTKELLQLPDVGIGFKRPEKGHAKKFTAYAEAHADGKHVIALSVRAMPSGLPLTTGEYVELISKTCDRLVDRYGCNILLIPQCTYRFGAYGEDDRHVAADVVRFSNRKENLFVVEDDINATDCIALYEGAIGAVCTRLHGCVFSIKQGIPTLGINYNPKVFEFYKWLGLEDYVLEIADIDAESIVDRFDDAVKKNEYFVERVEKAIDAGVRDLEKYADLAVKVMA